MEGVMEGVTEDCVQQRKLVLELQEKQTVLQSRHCGVISEGVLSSHTRCKTRPGNLLCQYGPEHLSTHFWRITMMIIVRTEMNAGGTGPDAKLKDR